MEKIQLFLSLVEGTNDLIHSVTSDRKFEFVNQAWLKTLGYSEDEFDKLELKDILFPGQTKTHSELVDRIFEGQKLTDVEAIFVTKTGEQIAVEGNMFPRIVDDKVVSATGFFRDITQRKATEESLNEQRARTEFFVDLMVHDITNINQDVISTMELLLSNDDFPEQLRDFVDEALNEVERGSNLVENVRKISSLHSITPTTKYYDLWTTITSAAKRVDDSYSDKELALKMNISENQYQLEADDFFEDVFYSILHNSMKFDKKKKVEVEISVEEIKHTPYVRIALNDHGPGIPDEEKEILFDKVTHRRESIAGLGLGLSLVKMVLDNYGAYISVEDRVSEDHTQGAKFIILMRHDPQSDVVTEVEE